MNTDIICDIYTMFVVFFFHAQKGVHVGKLVVVLQFNENGPNFERQFYR